MPKPIELRQQRAKLISDARKILDTADTEKRNLNTEERATYDRTLAQVDDLGKEIEIRERQEAEERAISQVDSRQVPPARGAPNEDTRAVERRDAFRKYLRKQPLSEIELRGLQADVNASGGYMVVPTEILKQYIIALDNEVMIRQKATVHTLTSAASLGCPTVNSNLSDAEWKTEIQEATEDTALTFGRRDLTPHRHTSLVKVSNQLLRSALQDPEALVMDRIRQAFGVTQEKAFMTGTGTGQPLGLFIASEQGISTSRDVAGSNSTTAIVADTLFTIIGTLPAQYRRSPSIAWLFHRDAITQIRKLKDSQNRYLFEPSLQVGQPDRLLGFPILESEYVPNTFTAGKYVGLFGDFKYYWIVDVANMDVQRLEEKYALSNEIGFLAQAYVDAAPVHEQAFVRMKLAAS